MPTDPSPAQAPSLSRRRSRSWAAVAGFVSAVVTLAVAEASSLLLGRAGSPFFAVGSAVVDLVPAGFKTLVIDLFGTADKLVLFVCLGILVMLLASAVGVAQLVRPPSGLVLLGAIGVVALLAVVTRAGATAVHLVPTIVGLIVGGLVLRVAIRRLDAWSMAVPRRIGTQFERRGFLRFVIATGASSVLVGAIARVAGAAAEVAGDVRRSIRLPAAATPAPKLPAGAELDIDGISPFVTPSAEFYRIDTALRVPTIDARSWTLLITGMVENDIEIGYEELLALPLEEHYVTLACVSNEVGGDLIGNALWLGYPVRELLARAKPMRGADMVLSSSSDGFSAGTPLEVLEDPDTAAILAVGMNGAPLPLDHGYPARLVVPGLYGYVSATKWVVRLEVTRFADQMGYWTPRGWSATGPVKLSSRIDTVKAGSSAASVIAGVAWAQHTGISAVEVQVDDGEWEEATLATAVTADTWVQWSIDRELPDGVHTATVRATDADGRIQTADVAPPAPDGSTGLHTVRFTLP